MAFSQEQVAAFVESMKLIANKEINKTQTTSSQVGVVVGDPQGFDAVVRIGTSEYNVELPEHLHDWIGENDVVIVQDLFGNGNKMTIMGSLGSTKDTNLVVEDAAKGKLVGGVTKLEGDNGGLSNDDLSLE